MIFGQCQHWTIFFLNRDDFHRTTFLLSTNLWPWFIIVIIFSAVFFFLLFPQQHSSPLGGGRECHGANQYSIFIFSTCPSSSPKCSSPSPSGCWCCCCYCSVFSALGAGSSAASPRPRVFGKCVVAGVGQVVPDPAWRRRSGHNCGGVEARRTRQSGGCPLTINHF